MIPYMNSVLYLPLIENHASGVDEVITRLLDYDLIKEDWDSIIDLYQWKSGELEESDSDDSHENKKADMMFKIVSTPVNTKKKAKTTRKIKT
ncbi:hypothetical protein MXB_2029 [Myxobolus squamalis]|nr:hypothetical protein MXB_2029 [Myxobolus squamalis]